MIDISKLKIGDTLVYKGKSFIAKMDKGYEHVAKYVGSSIDGKLIVMHAHLWAKGIDGAYHSGVFESYVDAADYKNIDVMRYHKEILEENWIAFFELMRKTVCGKVFYNFYGFIRLWVWSNILRPINLGNLDTNVSAKNGEVCSTWFHEQEFKHLKDIDNKPVDELPEIEEDAGCPSDYSISKCLNFIC